MLKRANIRLDINDETKSILEHDIPVFIAANHKSMWETAGIPLILHKEFDRKVISGAGQQLFDGLSKKFMNFGTTFDIQKDKKASSIKLIDDITSKLDNYESVLVFPEGTRSRDGHLANYKSSVFEAPIQSKRPVIIIPADVTYPKIPELELFSSNSKYSFKPSDIKYLAAKLNPVTISFGKPLYNRHFSNRKELSKSAQEQAKSLVHVHPTNIYALAFVDNETTLGSSIDDTIQKLSQNTDRFTHLPSKFFTLQNKQINLNIPDSQLNFYANQVRHYLK